MKPWFPGDMPESRPALLVEAARVIGEAHEGLPDVRNVILFDLGYNHQATIVAMPVPGHVHGQDCGRA